MYVKREGSKAHELIRARDIVGKKVSYLKKCIGGLAKKQVNKPPLPLAGVDGAFHANDWLFLLGLYVRNGVAADNGHTVVMLSQTHAVLERLKTTCQNLQLKMTLTKTSTVHLHSEVLSKFLRNNNIDRQKSLPHWSLCMSRVHSLSMLQGVMGCPNSSLTQQRHQLMSASSALCDQIQILALNAGAAVNITPGADNCWCVTIVPSKFRRVETRPTQQQLHQPQPQQPQHPTEQIVFYTGSVHCITVRTGIFYVRRQGKGAWTGNSSRHGQKGVIGIILNAVDMPVSEEGIVPDIIVNPHAIPSRMTIGQLMECLMGKLCAIEGKQGDATPFRDASIEHIGKCLEEHGFDNLGRETLHNGMTGEPLPSKVFIGPTYYQRLKHMVLDKQHSRSRGPVQILTRQPVEGRAREGGLRFGEMERDCIIRYAPSPCAHQNHSHPLYSLTPLHSRWQPRCGKRPVRTSLRTIGSIRRNRMRQLRTARTTFRRTHAHSTEKTILPRLQIAHRRTRRAHAVCLQTTPSRTYGHEHRSATTPQVRPHRRTCRNNHKLCSQKPRYGDGIVRLSSVIPPFFCPSARAFETNV